MSEPSDYAAFLAAKQRVDKPTGFEVVNLNPNLFPFQQAIVRWACRRGRASQAGAAEEPVRGGRSRRGGGMNREPPIGHCQECDDWHVIGDRCPNAFQIEWWLAAIGIVAGVVTLVLALRGAVGR